MKFNHQIKIDGNVKDRGNIKWNAMMLAEHVQMLREWQKEDRYDVMPDLEEHDFEAIQEEIGIALSRQCYVELKVWNKGYRFCTGIINSINLQKKQIVLSHQNGSENILFSEMVGIRILE